jgi:hypothetical protein
MDMVVLFKERLFSWFFLNDKNGFLLIGMQGVRCLGGGSGVREVTCGSAGRTHLPAEASRGASSAVFFSIAVGFLD